MNLIKMRKAYLHQTNNQHANFRKDIDRKNNHFGSRAK
jgi:hypothetical protein